MKGRGHASKRLYFLEKREVGFGLQGEVACSLTGIQGSLRVSLVILGASREAGESLGESEQEMSRVPKERKADERFQKE